MAISTTLTEASYEAFEKARALVSRKKPGASVEDVLNELVEHYLKARAPKERKSMQKRGPSADQGSRRRHIPGRVRDQVMLRDREQCQFVGSGGRRCGSRHNLQIDHIRPYANGGTHDLDNLQVLCAAHNRHRAVQQFGPPPTRS